MNLKDEIKVAFGDTEAPVMDSLCDGIDSDGINDYFLGTKWQDHNETGLHYNSSALTFFNAEAFSYYLPAFLIASFDNQALQDLVPCSLNPPKNDPNRPSFVKWWSLLSRNQKTVVVKYLKHFADDTVNNHRAAGEVLEQTLGR